MASKASNDKREEKPLIAFRDGLDSRFADRFSAIVWPLLRLYFRASIRGFKNIPEDNKFIIVSNHNGFPPFEVPFLFSAWWRRFGENKKILGLAHQIAFRLPIFKYFLPKIGALYAHPENAERAIDEGYALALYPGGESEAVREIWDRKSIVFNNHSGFIRLALRKNLKIIPLVSFGGTDHYPLISNCENLASFIGLPKKFRVHHIPFTFQFFIFLSVLIYSFVQPLSTIWVLLSFIFIFIPLPLKMTLKLLPAIDPDEFVDVREDPERSIQRIYDVVTQRMQTELNKGHS